MKTIINSNIHNSVFELMLMDEALREFASANRTMNPELAQRARAASKALSGIYIQEE